MKRLVVCLMLALALFQGGAARSALAAGKTVLVPLAEGFEEIEALTVVDVLRRAGAEVVLASLAGTEVRGANGVVVRADATLDRSLDRDYDLVALPGGLPGAEHLAASPALSGLLRRQAGQGRPVAAICASPALVLEPLGLLAGRRATTYPSFSGRLTSGTYVPERVVADGPVITSAGPGTALEFSLALVRALYGEEAARSLGQGMLAR